MPPPKSDMFYTLDSVMNKSRSDVRCHSSRKLARDRILSERRGFSHSVNHPQVLRHMFAHVVAAELGDFISQHLRQSRLRLAAVAPEGACDGLFQADKDFFFGPASSVYSSDARESNQFLNTRLELSAQLLNLVIPGCNGSQKRLYCPRVLKLKKVAGSPREAAYKIELERIRNRTLKEICILSYHLVGLYFCVPEGSEQWEQMLQYDGFVTTLSLLCQFGDCLPAGLETYKTDVIWDDQFGQRNSHYTPALEHVMRSKSRWYSALWSGSLLARAVAYTCQRRHASHAHATRCLLKAVFNRRGRNEDPSSLCAYELLSGSAEGDDFCALSWLAVAETNGFRSFLANFDVSSLSAVELLAHRLVYTMAVLGDSGNSKCLSTCQIITILSEKIYHLWRTCQRATADSGIVLPSGATEEGRCLCGDMMTLHVWMLCAVARSHDTSVPLEEWTAHTFVTSVCGLVEHLLQPDWLSALSAVALLRFLTDITAMFPQLVTLICEGGRESATSALMKCGATSGSIAAQAVELTANLFGTPHRHSSRSELLFDSSKCMITDPQLKNQLSPALVTAARGFQKIGT